MPPLNKFAHLPEEERQQQGSNVRAIHVRVSHDNYSVITKFIWIKFFLANATAQSRDNRAHLCVTKHFVKARAFDIQDLAFKG